MLWKYTPIIKYSPRRLLKNNIRILGIILTNNLPKLTNALNLNYYKTLESLNFKHSTKDIDKVLDSSSTFYQSVKYLTKLYPFGNLIYFKHTLASFLNVYLRLLTQNKRSF